MFSYEQCGQTTLPLDNLTGNQSLHGHLPWTVGVFELNEKGELGVTAGVLVRENAVLTGQNWTRSGLPKIMSHLTDRSLPLTLYLSWRQPGVPALPAEPHRTRADVGLE